LHTRLISENAAVSDAAKKEFLTLDENTRKQTLLDIIDAFGSEEDPYRRGRMLDMLKDLNAGSYAVIPLIKAATKNPSIRDFKEVTSFLNTVKPGEQDIPALKEMLKHGAWEARMLAMTSLAVLSKKAEVIMPELMDMLDEFGADAGKYSGIFDSMAMINPEIAVAGVIRGITSPDARIQ